MKISDFDRQIIRKLKLKLRPTSYFVYDSKGCTVGSGLSIKEARTLKQKVRGTVYAVYENYIHMRTCEVLD